jgi:holo-[acyl-carrier protein] synthase
MLHREVDIRAGFDLVSVPEVADALARFGDRYVSRVFTSDEALYCRAALGMAAAERFAARFAAKEAALKVLMPAGRWGNWREIEVRRQKSGRCDLVLHGDAAALAAARGVARLSLSMSHDGDRAAAFVIAQISRPRRADRRSHHD